MPKGGVSNLPGQGTGSVPSGYEYSAPTPGNATSAGSPGNPGAISVDQALAAYGGVSEGKPSGGTNYQLSEVASLRQDVNRLKAQVAQILAGGEV